MNKGMYFILGILSIAIILLGIYNIKNNQEFMYTSAYQVLSLIFAIIFGFYYTQRINNQKNSKDATVRLILNIQTLLSDKRFRTICCEEDVDFVKMKLRTVANKIDCLESFSKKLKIQEEFIYIKKKFDEYEEFIGNHVSDLMYLKKSEKELSNFSELIDNKCDYIVVSLYK